MPKRRPQHQPQLITQLFAMLLLVVGVGVALYPFYSGALNTMLDRARVARVDRENQATAKQQRAALAKTNALLKNNGLHADADPFSGLSKKQKVNLHKDQIGSLTVPKLKLTVPVFKTLIDETLAIGAAVVPGTDMPIGGINTHTVIAGHRGLVDRRLFRDLNHLKRGNLFVFKVAGKHLAYRVFRIQVVKPSDTEILRHEPGQDLATLVTCTPYMINSHRLLVTGRRVPYTPAIAKAVAAAKRAEWRQQLAIFIASLVGLLALLGVLGRYWHALLLKRHRFDLSFVQVDGNGAAVAGSGYTLTNRRGQAVYRHGQPLMVTTDAVGQATITHLPGGRYRLQAADWSVSCGTKKLHQRTGSFYPTKAQATQVQWVHHDHWQIQR